MSTRPPTRMPYTTLCRANAVDGAAGRDDLLAGRLRQRGVREEVRRRGDRADLHPHPAHVPGRRVLFDPAAARLGAGADPCQSVLLRSEEHTSELQSLMRISYAVFCLKKKIQN